MIAPALQHNRPTYVRVIANCATHRDCHRHGVRRASCRTLRLWCGRACSRWHEATPSSVAFAFPNPENFEVWSIGRYVVCGIRSGSRGGRRAMPPETREQFSSYGLWDHLAVTTPCASVRLEPTFIRGWTHLSQARSSIQSAVRERGRAGEKGPPSHDRMMVDNA
ncbi:hypothetical protein L226DRAFT_185959 [Lentinus tigrinus ALCF2SS1-7]|uniref:uncharacterized protein n=1 Tax=Lentinus tigrinus ALCF2SS1-7 TaxID=1328758 RepID=UPI0011663893|nr:hypothetical protein L226DRAFT_185959 [Lentinus tigrinus ALCF2SS1-7]